VSAVGVREAGGRHRRGAGGRQEAAWETGGREREDNLRPPRRLAYTHKVGRYESRTRLLCHAMLMPVGSTIIHDGDGGPSHLRAPEAWRNRSSSQSSFARWLRCPARQRHMHASRGGGKVGTLAGARHACCRQRRAWCPPRIAPAACSRQALCLEE